MMYTPALFTLLTATALALPTPQAFLTGIPSVFLPSPYPGCIGGMPCPSWVMRQWGSEKKLTGESAETEKNEQSLTVRQETGEDEAGVFYCKDVGWGGDCIYRRTPLGSDPKDCTQLNLPASSVGPDEGYYCIFYTQVPQRIILCLPRILIRRRNAVCAPLASDGSDTLSLTYPGTDNLGFTAKGDFNDRLLSYQCFREEDVALDPMEKSDAQEFENAKAAFIGGKAE
ncbi:hypothetical protein E8E12_010588 [Didymella heteroderae]|uniref:Uncharacterized protein n=1 Tax=Didymella heteroderae TaxID=1769908 RepID=A0A9P4X1L2_9PLEO|nr:hypothetical protein E8E12_010588 [Didymella heteroderae]